MFRLRISNAAWAQRGYPRAGELDVLAQAAAPVNLLDFIAARAVARIINEVAYETEDRIPELLAGGITRTPGWCSPRRLPSAAWEKQFDGR